jgi:hypothetical protein
MRTFVLLVPLALAVAGCIAPAAVPALDPPMALPIGEAHRAAWTAEHGYTPLEQLEARLDAVAQAHPDLVRIEVLGESREGRPLRALVLAAGEGKPVAFLDAGHHANEVEGIETVLFVAEFLAANRANATVRAWLDAVEVWALPLVNPDGYVVQTRYNAAGANLNRNYDLDWCNPIARNSCPPGPAHEATMPLLGPSPENAGTAPFSEPESSAVRDAILGIGDRLAFYVSHHTPAHCLARPWTAPNPPFPMPPEHLALYDEVFAWVEGSTEYGGGTWTTPGGTCMDYHAGGTSQDWVYATARVPTFTMEVAGTEEWEGLNPFTAGVTGLPEYARDLPHWLAATLPIDLYLLHNAARLQAWDAALEVPPLPGGAPPEA